MRQFLYKLWFLLGYSMLIKQLVSRSISDLKLGSRFYNFKYFWFCRFYMVQFRQSQILQYQFPISKFGQSQFAISRFSSFQLKQFQFRCRPCINQFRVVYQSMRVWWCSTWRDAVFVATSNQYSVSSKISREVFSILQDIRWRQLHETIQSEKRDYNIMKN